MRSGGGDSLAGWLAGYRWLTLVVAQVFIHQTNLCGFGFVFGSKIAQIATKNIFYIYFYELFTLAKGEKMEKKILLRF